MPLEMPQTRITVLKRTLNQDLIDKYLLDEYRQIGRCELLEEGQEFIVKDYSSIPEGFCVSAWVDIFKDVMLVASGGDMPGMRSEGTVICGCSDWFRPVVFRIERIESSKREDEEVHGS